MNYTMTTKLCNTFCKSIFLALQSNPYRSKGGRGGRTAGRQYNTASSLFGSSQPPSQNSPQQPIQNQQQFPPSFPTTQQSQPGQNSASNQGAAGAHSPATSFIDTAFQPTQYASPQETPQSTQNFFSPPGQIQQPSAGPNIMSVNQPEGKLLSNNFNFNIVYS